MLSICIYYNKDAKKSIKKLHKENREFPGFLLKF